MLGNILALGNTAWRNYVVDGVPSSGVNQPLKSDIQAFVAAIGQVLAFDSTAGVLQVGDGALHSAATGAQNIVAVGTRALYSHTTGTYSTAVGYEALYNSIGHANTALGAGAGGSITTATDSVAIGADALRNCETNAALNPITGANNIGVGVHTLGHLTSGVNNIAIGHLALVGGGAYTGFPSALLTGSNNLGMGYLTLGNITGAMSENVALGHSALTSLAAGDQNIAIGPYAGQLVVSGSLNILIGRDVRPPSGTTASNELNIGNLITGTGLTQGGAPSTGTLTINGTLTTAPGDFPFQPKTNTAGGGTLLIGAATDASINISQQTLVSQGTVAAPTAVATGYLLASPLYVKGHDGTDYSEVARIAVYALGTISTGIVPGKMSLQTAGNGGTLAEGLTVDNGQNVATLQGLFTAASTTGRAGLNVPHGTAPTSPTNGDIWTTTAGLFVRVNGATKTVTLT